MANPISDFVSDPHKNHKAHFVRGWGSNPWRRGYQTFVRKQPLLITQVLPCRLWKPKSLGLGLSIASRWLTKLHHAL